MNQAMRDFLSLALPPARLSATEAGWLLGFSEHDVSILMSVGLLKPLGHPPSCGSKYFAAVELQTLRSDSRWLARASDAIVNYWRKKNAGRLKKTTQRTQGRPSKFEDRQLSGGGDDAHVLES